ncbi:MAG: cobalamin-binding protein [Candidatus Saganbacteria bacterium]|nr:cobalamin-binding protein [Candidatus Saganbacteria bacterium]
MRNLACRAVLAVLIFLAFSGPARAYPQRIVSGIPSATEILFALGLGDRIVGVTDNCNYPPAARRKERVGGFFLNLEKVVSLKPDLVVMAGDAQRRDIDKFRGYGLTVFTVEPRSVNGVMEAIVKLGRETGRERRAAEVVAGMKRRLAAVHPTGLGLGLILRKRPRVLAVVGYEPLIVVGGGTFIGDIMRQAGAENIAGRSGAAYPQYSFENLVRENPEYLVIPKGVVSRSALARDPRWRRLSAVQGNKVLIIDADLLSRPGPRVVEAVAEIAHFIYGKNI